MSRYLFIIIVMVYWIIYISIKNLLCNLYMKLYIVLFNENMINSLKKWFTKILVKSLNIK